MGGTGESTQAGAQAALGLHSSNNVSFANISVSGNVDGRDVSADGLKLDTIETNADVTDATNVEAAGAVMDGDFSSNGLMARTGAGSYTNRTITGTSSQISVTNGDGVSGNPTISLPSSIEISGVYGSNNGTATTRLFSSGGAGYLETQTNHPLVFQINASEIARFSTGGNLLLNTTGAGGRLTVQAGSGERGIWVDTDTDQEGAMFSDNTQATLRLVPASGGRFELRTDGGQVLVLSPGGTDTLETSNSGDVNLPAGRLQQGGNDLVPAGSMTMFAGSSTPGGWLLCDGSAVSRTTYADLFTAIGTTWGAGDGSTTFNVPDMRNVAPYGAGNAVLGTTTGSINASSQNTSGAGGGHDHGNVTTTVAASAKDSSTTSVLTDVSAVGNHTHAVTHPSAAVNFIIKT